MPCTLPTLVVTSGAPLLASDPLAPAHTLADHRAGTDAVGFVTYWDTFWQDNNTTSHPGEGIILPVDAHPNVLIRGDGQPWRSRVQSYDSTFGLYVTDAITLHFNGAETTHPSQPAVPVFDDTQSYWSPHTPFSGVKVPNTGTTVRVKSVSVQGALMQIEVAPK
mgnify:CR=1 FL=1